MYTETAEWRDETSATGSAARFSTAKSIVGWAIVSMRELASAKTVMHEVFMMNVGLAFGIYRMWSLLLTDLEDVEQDIEDNVLGFEDEFIDYAPWMISYPSLLPSFLASSL